MLLEFPLYNFNTFRTFKCLYNGKPSEIWKALSDLLALPAWVWEDEICSQEKENVGQQKGEV